MSEIKKYCEGLDCAICDEKEPCIYKIANELQEKLIAKEQECEELKGRLKYIINENRELKDCATDEHIDIVALKNYISTLEFYVDQLKAENEELKKAYARLNSLYNNNCNFTGKLEKTLIEIKEIAEGMHDLWINKTPYTDIDNLVTHLLECELNRIRYKVDDISENEAV